MDEPVKPTSDDFWLVITPSVDHEGWVNAAHAAAYEIGWPIVAEHEIDDAPCASPRLVITIDADRARAAGAHRIAAIVAEPETCIAAVAELVNVVAPDSLHIASALLARALALAPDNRVVTAAELMTKPQELVLFDALRVTPPKSRAEFPREPTVAAAFRLYREVAAGRKDAIEWSEGLFTYCPRAGRDKQTSGMLDTTGRPRILVNGPYLSMPTGLWRATIRFGVDKDAARRQYRLDWGTRTATVSEYVTPSSDGLYELSLDFDWVEVDVAEMRLILMEGSFTGTLLFQGLTIQKIAAPQAEVKTAA